MNLVLMAKNWVCSECGMVTGRRANVERHIKNKHEARGMPMIYMDYMLEVEAGALPYPTYRRPSALQEIEIRKPTNSEILLEHSYRKITRLVPTEFESIRNYVGLEKLDRTIFRAEICEKCYSHKVILNNETGQTISENEGHICDPSWSFDHPDVCEPPERAIELLRLAIPQYLTRFLRQNARFSDVKLIASKRIRQSTDPTPDETTTQIIIDSLSKQPKSEQDNKVLIRLIVLASYVQNERIKREGELLKVIKLNPKLQYNLLSRACKQGILKLDNEELLQFFSIFSSTGGIANVEGKEYFIYLLF
jgi:hypothetical protein